MKLVVIELTNMTFKYENSDIRVRPYYPKPIMELWIIGSIFGARTNIAVHAYLGAIFFLVYFLFSGPGRNYVSITLALRASSVKVTALSQVVQASFKQKRSLLQNSTIIL